MNELNNNHEEKTGMQPLANKEITDPNAIQALLHEDKRKILIELTRKELKIIELEAILGINPGTIKRYLDNLTEIGLVFPPRVVINRQNIKEKYYRAVAMKFTARIELP